MPSSFRQAVAVSHPVLPDIGKARQAKADVRKPDVQETPDYMRLVGSVVEIAVSTVGWTHKEAAGKVGVDDAEFGKWINGTRRPQFDKLSALEALRWPMVMAWARVLGVAEVEETIKRIA